MKRFRACALLIVAVAACRRTVPPPRPVVMLTTQRLTTAAVAHAAADAFHRQTSVPVEVRSMSAEDLLKAADARSGAVAIYRDPDLDAELLARHAVRLHNAFAREEYVIVGPRRDPARVARAKTAVDAFERIASARQVFCTPADLPVLLDVEHEIWAASEDEEPPSGSRYRRCRGNAAEVLGQAERFDAYTITDAATAEARLPKGLQVLLRGVPILQSTYVVALLEYPEASRNRNAEWFVEWMMSYRGREVVQGLRSASVPRLYLP